MANSTYLLASLCDFRDLLSYSLLRDGHINDELRVLILLLLPFDDDNVQSEVNSVSEVPIHDTRHILPFPPDPVINDESSFLDSAYHHVGENDVGKTKVDNRHVPPRVSLRPKRSTKMATASQLYGDFISQDDSDYEEQGDEPQWTENRRNNRRRRFQDRSALEATCSSEDVVKDRSAVLERRQEKEKQDAAFAHQTAANKDQMELTALAKVSNIFLLHVVTSLFHRASSFLGSWSSSCRL